MDDLNPGGQGCLYRPVGCTRALGSNWHWSTVDMQPLRRWRTDVRRRLPSGTSWPYPMPGGPLLRRGCPLVSSRVFLSWSQFIIWYFSSFISLSLFLITPCRNTDSPKLWNSVSINPNSMFKVDICPYSCLVDGLKWTITIVNTTTQDTSLVVVWTPLPTSSPVSHTSSS
jgi:hypothetical protein